MTEHNDIITPLLKGAPRLGLASGPASARVSLASPLPQTMCAKVLQVSDEKFY